MRDFFADRLFFSTLGRLWLPITFQQLIFSLLSLITVAMLGQLGEKEVAAVSLANQIAFLLQLLLFGVSSGAAIYIAQFWGMRDLKSIRHVFGICIGVGLIGALIFSFIAILIPERALAVYTDDPAVIALGSDCLRIGGLSYFALAITTSFAVTLRSTGNVRLPVTVSVMALASGAALNYALIFGEFGLPALGAPGSALATLFTRWVECGMMIITAYTTRSIAAASVREMFSFDRQFLGRVLRTVLPVTLNEILWSIGTTTYNVIFAHIGTEALAAYTIARTIENMAFVPFVGLANAAAVMIGHRVGSGENQRAFGDAWRIMSIVIAGGLLTGGAIIPSTDYILGHYNLDSNTQSYAHNILILIAIALTIKVSNMMFIVGIMRAGGDTRASAIIDVSTLWLIGLPSAALGAFAFGWSADWVYALAMLDEIGKVVLASVRVISKKWIRKLAEPERSHNSLEP